MNESLIGSNKFNIGDSLSSAVNGQTFCSEVKGITFWDTGTIQYHLVNETAPWPDNYISMPEAHLYATNEECCEKEGIA